MVFKGRPPEVGESGGVDAWYNQNSAFASKIQALTDTVEMVAYFSRAECMSGFPVEIIDR
jgi:hypothetical protein